MRMWETPCCLTRITRGERHFLRDLKAMIKADRLQQRKFSKRMNCNNRVIVEGDEEAAMIANLKVGSLGNVRAQTLHGFSVDELEAIISKMPIAL